MNLRNLENIAFNESMTRIFTVYMHGGRKLTPLSVHVSIHKCCDNDRILNH